ncbi:MAG: hypothetical protein VKJ04_08260 [Vampirovibrionales bacterium]|nr:hypothetical protein [Vampirovibrionales bacterium]
MPTLALSTKRLTPIPSACLSLAVGTVCFAVCLLLAACGGEDPEQKPDVAGNAQSRLVALQKQGITVALAQELVAIKANPFLSKLPITADAVAEVEEPPPPIEGASNEPPPIAADPFEGITLVGVAYQPKNAYALLSIAGGSSQVVRVGDPVTTEGGQLKVTKIGPDLVELKSSGVSQQTETLLLPDIVGFGASSGANGGSNSDNRGSSASSTANPTANSSEGGNTTTDTSNGIDVGKSIKEAAKAVFEPPGKVESPGKAGSARKRSSSGHKPIIKLQE